ncbi:MAG: hypothetical protein C4562_06415 [Actinobacteria bacterium]|nr:MAG: hypothetical protein C4562_06415 [Actinomycetota bacterium]
MNEAKKTNTWPVIIAIVAVLLTCLLTSLCVGGYYFFFSPEKKAQALMDQADKHLKTAQSIALETNKISSSLKADSSPKSLKKLANIYKPKIEDFKEEALIAKESLAQVNELNVSDKTKETADLRLRALSKLVKGIDLFADWSEEIGKLGEFFEKFQLASSSHNKATALINSAVESANSSNLLGTKSDATKAKKLLDKARNEYKEAASVDKTIDLSKLFSAIEYFIEASDNLLVMAKVTKSKTSEYNAAVNKLNTAIKKGSDAQSKVPFIADSNDFIESKLSPKIKGAIDYFEQAEKLDDESRL